MYKDDVIKVVKAERIIAIIRGIDGAHIHKTVEALLSAEIRIMEITMNTPEATDLISSVNTRFRGSAIIGAGTVMSPDDVRRAVSVGAQFIVCPHTDKRVIDAAKAMERVILPGALSPTEVVNAVQAGADLVKLFPAVSVGPNYIKQLHGPFDTVDFIAVGGINLNNAASFIEAGAVGVGIGGELINKTLIYNERYDEITELAKRFKETISI